LSPSEELRMLEEVKEYLQKQLSDIEKRIEELRKSGEEKR
jgi:prefoldin subunit 5